MPAEALPKRPTRIIARPAAPSSNDAAMPSRRRRRLGAGATARSAAIGGTRVERMAGTSEASRVTTIPTSSETITVRDSITRPVVGRSISNASSRALSSIATRKPPPIPTSAPIRPIASASITTSARIWRREAPSVRSIPNSETRWATVIEKVLKIRNEPTRIAMKAKTSRKICRKLRFSRISSEPRSALSCAVSTLTPAGISARDPPFQGVRRDSLGRRDRDLVEAADLVGQPLRHRQRHLGDAGAAEGGAAEPREADQAEGAGAALADQLDLFSQLHAGRFGGRPVERGFVRPARPVPFDVGERLERGRAASRR